ncbi:MAG: tyrosine-type recombinase/integrase [Gaiellaceae bacterium]
MASTWIVRRQRSDGGTTYRVLFRLGGRESMPKHGGSFRTMREARIRRDWIAGELAAVRVPRLSLDSTSDAQTVEAAAAAWQASRVDVAEGTAATHRVNLRRILPVLGDRDVSSIEPFDVAALVSQLHEGGLKRESIRKTVGTLAMVLDFAGRTGERNPARDRLTVKLPYETREEPKPPTAEQVLAVFALLPRAYRLPLLVLDATGMRVGELEALTWGDVDEARSRWRVSRAVAKTGQARWVVVPEPLFRAVVALVPREDRTPERRVFLGVTADRLRTAINRACTAAGVPAFSPHDLRHRRISLEHLRGMPWARIGELVGQRNLAVTANTYTHVLVDETEIDYATLTAG